MHQTQPRQHAHRGQLRHAHPESQLFDQDALPPYDDGDFRTANGLILAVLIGAVVWFGLAAILWALS